MEGGGNSGYLSEKDEQDFAGERDRNALFGEISEGRFRMIASDASPLICLAKAGKLSLLRELFGKVLIEEEVSMY